MTNTSILTLGSVTFALPDGLLSGGERLKAALAGVLYGDKQVQLLLLDEPSIHLDLPALAALENMLRQYRGSLLVASHDQVFLQRIAIDAELRLDAHYRA